MKKALFLLILFSSVFYAQAQRPKFPKAIDTTASQRNKKPMGKGGKEEKVSIIDYKIISLEKDTTYFDTTLTIQKEYKYNYLRKDDFELLPFSNLGQTYNSLGLNFSANTLYPQIGARAKHFNYMQVNDINYYHVPTPITDLFFKTSMEQGQLIDALVTLNTSKQFNMSIAYKGLRSLGKYQHILTSTGNFRFTSNYITKNKKYNLKAHFVSQDILNQENGGVSLKEEQFETGNPEFIDRSRMDVNFENAENFLVGKRYFLDHEYVFFKAQDSAKSSAFSLGHQFNYETKRYEFRQAQAAVPFFGEAFQSAKLNDKASLKTLFNQFSLNHSNSIVGSLKFKASLYKYSYFFNSIVVGDDQTIKNRLKGDEFAIGGEWTKNIGKFGIMGDVSTNISGNMGGALIKGAARYRFDAQHSIKASISSLSRMPNYNFLLYQSDYESYNWQHDDSFKKEQTKSLDIEISTKHFGNLKASYNVLDNYTYFSQPVFQGDSLTLLSPEQYNNTINYLKVTYSNEFRAGKLALNNTLMYQSVDQQDNILNVPQFVTRNTLYYSNHLFKKALYLQTGVTFKYFTSYNANAYSPLLGEFYVQDREEIGGFPLLDFFINAKVRQTRIYLKAEHFNSSFTGYKYYSAPNYPYRDFIVRFGLVWNFFS